MDTLQSDDKLRHEMISAAAYRRYEARGQAPGDAYNDWLEAEKEVDATLARGGAESAEGIKDALVRMLSGAVGESQALLDELAARAQVAGTALSNEYQRQIELLQPKLAAARAKLPEIREHTGGAWEHLKDGVEKAAGEVRLAARQVATLLK